MSEPARILHVISRLDGYGGARLLRHIAARQSREGRHVSVAALQVDPSIASELSAAGVTVTSLGSRWGFDPTAIWRLTRERQRTTYDVVHAWDSRALVHAVVSGRREPLVAAWTTAGAAPRWISQLAAPTVATIPPGAAPPSPERPSREAVLHELRLPSDARVIAVAGPLVRGKEFDEAIWCFELVRVLHPTARMLVFGDGPDRLRLERYAELVSEPGCVRFAGYRPDWQSLAAGVDVYWQLDAARTTPFALLEAMAAGVPAVASNLPAFSAAVTAGVTGLLAVHRVRADVARATDQLLNDSLLSRRLGEAGATAVAERWSLEKSVAVFDAVYRALSPRRPAGGQQN